MKVLITGTSSGLGKFLYKNIKSFNYDRNKHHNYTDKEWDLIIHTANANSEVLSLNDLFNYKNSNISLTEKITNLRYKKLIYTSSTQVYQGIDTQDSSENNLSKILSQKSYIYSFTKLISESIIMNSNPNNIILRLGSMIGEDMRKNNISKILFDRSFDLTLTPNSKIAFISHEEVFNFINKILNKNLCGIFNFSRNDRLSLENICNHFNNFPNNFGNYFFESNIVNLNKYEKIYNLKYKKSIEILEEFYKK